MLYGKSREQARVWNKSLPENSQRWWRSDALIHAVLVWKRILVCAVGFVLMLWRGGYKDGSGEKQEKGPCGGGAGNRANPRPDES